MERIKDNKEKNKPGLIFVISVPVSFSISISSNLREKFKNTFKDDMSNTNRYLRKKFLDIFEVNNIHELLKKNKNIRKKVNELKNEFRDESGLSVNEVSSWARKVIEEKIKEDSK